MISKQLSKKSFTLLMDSKNILTYSDDEQWRFEKQTMVRASSNSPSVLYGIPLSS